MSLSNKFSQINNKGLILILATAFVSGFSVFLNSFGVKGINPFLFTGIKNFIVGLMIIGLVLKLKQKDTVINDFKKNSLSLTVIAIIGGSIPFMLFFKGLQLSTSGQGAFIHKSMLLLVIPLAIIILKEKLKGYQLLAAALILLGNLLLFRFYPPLQVGLGELLILTATCFWAFENVLAKRLFNKGVAVNSVITSRMFLGSLIILAYTATTGIITDITTLSASAFVWILITATLLFAYVNFWYNGLKKVNLITAVIILTLAAPITATLDIIFLHKIPTAINVIALLLIVFAVILTILRSNKFFSEGKIDKINYS